MTRIIVLGGGCFWGVEELFRAREGVVNTEVGYCGGENDNPSYENHPGHAETVKIEYDPKITSLEKILDFFFTIHDPTTPDRQGNDQGPSYRSVIFYSNKQEKKIAISVIDKVNRSDFWKKPVVTSLEPLSTFYPAEDYHQDYLQKNPGGYTCHFQRLSSYPS